MIWNIGFVSLVTKALAISDAAAQRLKFCRHPAPQYVKAEPGEVDGTRGVGRPAHYRCSDCGQSWAVVQRDPAWAPTRIVQKFSGHDPSKATSAIMRAEIEAQQRRFLAANRTTIPKPAALPAPKPAVPRRHRRPSNVIEIASRRKPA